ncbi:MAG TPA: chemotaxis protein CheA [Thermotogota bacterium]|nr:chemotaxis protein CheA [Thermotogota bacterium]HPR96425.1 chemotaxis protein CheA [Thermotogota bacterium]
MSNLDSEMLEVFLTDAEEHLSILENELLNLESDPENPETIKTIFRSMHTLKGSAGFVNLTEIESFTHQLEGLMSALRDERISNSPEIIEVLFQSKDIIHQMVKAVSSQGDFPDQKKINEVEYLIGKLGQTPEDTANTREKDKTPEIDTKADRYFRIEMTFRKDVYETGTDPLLLIEDLAAHCIIRQSVMKIKDVPPLPTLDPFINNLSWKIIVESPDGKKAIDEVFIFASMDNEIIVDEITKDEMKIMDDSRFGEILVKEGYLEESEIIETLDKHQKIGEELVKDGMVTRKVVDSIAQKQQEIRKIQRASTLRIETEKLDRILESIGEVVVVKSRIRQIMERKGWMDLEEEAALTELDRYINHLQKDVMDTRMVAIKDTLLPFRRLVRDLAKKENKLVNFEIKGESTELDKTITEKIKDPLKHMLRNSIDHGIESPEERVRVGKPQAGYILLEASHQNGEVMIRIQDDGKGIDPVNVTGKAIEKGLIEPGRLLTQEEANKMIFNPGFSTAKVVTDISGRGVGMDVVNDNINLIHGDIEVRSEPGKGSTFIIHIPLTLAIIDGILITAGFNRLIIPIQSVVKFLPLDESAIHHVNNGSTIEFQNAFIPVIDLASFLGFNPGKRKMLIIVQSGYTHIALIIDEIIGKYQIVIKSLEENFRKVDHCSGATVLGDGNVALILDAKSLIRSLK